MYGENAISDWRRIARAALTNQVARFAPGLYVTLTRQTGRGRQEGSAADIASYFRKCFADYFTVLGMSPNEIEAFLLHKDILEYGPGDTPGVALLMLAHGARSVICVDEFPLYRLSERSAQVMKHIVDGLEGHRRRRAEECFHEKGNPASGFRPERLRYLVTPSGLSGISDGADLICSRSVLEHVRDLPASFADMRRALRTSGVAVHKVDLRSHGLHHRNPLDFLTWPAKLWKLMYQHKGFINRWRIDRYREILKETPLTTVSLTPTAMADAADVSAVRPYLAAPFDRLSDEDLACLGFWLVCRRA
jgi:SAM-dependent methyltransferase